MKIRIIIAILVFVNIVASFLGMPILGKVPTDGFQFGLISFCAVFAGFHSMLYGMFSSFLVTESAARYRGTGILEKRNQTITDGIISSILCIFCGIILVLYSPQENGITTLFTTFIYQTEWIFLLWTICCFCVSFLDMRRLIVKPALKKINEHTLSKHQLDKIKKQLHDVEAVDSDENP